MPKPKKFIKINANFLIEEPKVLELHPVNKDTNGTTNINCLYYWQGFYDDGSKSIGVTQSQQLLSKNT